MLLYTYNERMHLFCLFVDQSNAQQRRSLVSITATASLQQHKVSQQDATRRRQSSCQRVAHTVEESHYPRPQQQDRRSRGEATLNLRNDDHEKKVLKPSMLQTSHSKSTAKKHVLFKDIEETQETTVTYSSHTEHVDYYEELEVTESHHTFDNSEGEAIFHQIIGSKLPDCRVESSPARRQTFVKEEECYQHLEDSIEEYDEDITIGDLVHEPSLNALNITDTFIKPLPTVRSGASVSSHIERCQSQHLAEDETQFMSAKAKYLKELKPDSPARRETYVAERFRSIHENENLPVCDVDGSPLRRQTFVKDLSDKMRRATLTLGTTLASKDTPKATHRSRMSLLESCSPLTPRKLADNNSISAITASCMNLLNQLDLDVTADSPNTTTVSLDVATDLPHATTVSFDATSDLPRDYDAIIVSPDATTHLHDGATVSHDTTTVVHDPNITIEQAPHHITDGDQSNLSLDVEACIKPLLLPVPSDDSRQSYNARKDSLLEVHPRDLQKGSSQNTDLDNDQEEYFDASDIIENCLHPIQSGDSQDSSDSEEFQDSLENLLEDHQEVRPSQTRPIVHHTNTVCDEPEADSIYLDDFEDSLHNLSSDTVTKETSILLPEDIVDIDRINAEGYLLSEPLNSQGTAREVVATNVPSKTYPSPWSNVSHLGSPCKEVAVVSHDILAETYQSPWADVSEAKSLDMCNDERPPNNETFCKPFDVAPRVIIETPAVREHRHLSPPPTSLKATEQTFMCASLSEFSFHPSNDPRRCSTGVKRAPPEVAKKRSIVGGTKLLFTHEPKIDEHLFKESVSPIDAIDGAQTQTIKPIIEADEGIKKSILQADIDSLTTATIKTDDKVSKEKCGLEFIKISPCLKRVASSPARKPLTWGKAKRSRCVQELGYNY